ncbi:MAG: U32 family peptidase [Alloprevotella sp.]|nr:U32 family peptidase [Alloprevotella sp.]
MRLILPVHDVVTAHQLHYEIPTAEFYAGFSLPEWTEKFGSSAELNKRAHLNGHDGEGWEFVETLRAVCGTAHLHLAMNARHYTPEQLAYSDYIIARIAELGAEAVIISDPALIPIVCRHGLRASVSTIFGAYNADLVKYLRDRGAHRIILPRDLSLHEIEAIIHDVPDIEYECFVMLEGCRFSNSHCMTKNPLLHFCHYVDQAATDFCYTPGYERIAGDATANNAAFHTLASRSCGVCALYDLMQMGVAAGKVVGRALPGSAITGQARILQKYLNFAKTCRTREEYLAHTPDWRTNSACHNGLRCYYPEARD